MKQYTNKNQTSEAVDSSLKIVKSADQNIYKEIFHEAKVYTEKAYELKINKGVFYTRLGYPFSWWCKSLNISTLNLYYI